MRRTARLAVVGSLMWLAFAPAAHSQTSAGAGSVVLLPQIADITGTNPADGWVTTVFVQNNAGSTDLTLGVTYYLSSTSEMPNAAIACKPLSVPHNQVVSFDPAAQCNNQLPTIPPTNFFGSMVLVDNTSTYKTNTFFAYSRAEKVPGTTFEGNGFSIEGFPVGNFSSATADVIGLKRTAAFPNYATNCFVDALNEQVDFEVILSQGDGTLIGTYPSSGFVALGPYQTVRLPDIFSLAGAPAGDYSNVRATFVNSDNSAMIGFCTVEATGSGSADFRIAKATDARDLRQARLACYGMDSCGATVPSTLNPAEITDASLKNIHYAIFDQPDFIKCDLVADSTTMSDLEMTLRGPGDPISSPTFTLPAGFTGSPYTAGGSGATGFYIYTGEKSTISSGATTRWYIDVQVRSGVVSPPLPLKYGIKCSSGNGISVPWLGTTAAATP